MAPVSYLRRNFNELQLPLPLLMVVFSDKTGEVKAEKCQFDTTRGGPLEPPALKKLRVRGDLHL